MYKPTARAIVKFLAKTTVAATTKTILDNTIDHHTQLDSDDLPVDIATTLGGWYVSEKVEPVTDRLVDTGANFFAARRQAKQEIIAE